MTTTRTLLSPLKQLLGTVNDERGLFARSTLSMTAAQLGTAATAALSALLVTNAVTGASPTIQAALTFGLIAAVTTVGLFTWIESWLSHVLAYRVIAALRMKVFDAVKRAVPSKQGKQRTGEITGTALADVEALEWFYAHTLGSGINAIVTPALISGALVVMVGPVGLVVPAGIALLLAIPWFLTPVQVTQGRRIRECLGELNAMAFEGSHARRELATLNLTSHHAQEVLKVTGTVQHAKRQFALRAAGETAMADIVIAATSLGFLALLVTESQRGHVAPTMIPVAVVLATAAIAPASGAFIMVQRLGEMSAAAQRVLRLLALGADHREGTDDMPEGGAGRGAMSHVTFGYTPNAPVLKDLDLTIEPGEHVALVGASGAGKSTIARLLTGLWAPDSGTIEIDGFGIGSATEVSLRRHVAMVSQHPYVFRGTVRSNLLLADPTAPDESLWKALSQAGLAATVTTWEKGLDHPVGDGGSTLSGGQRQRLSIAQALLRDPAVMILDEASAQLDTIHEAHLAHTLAEVRKHRTTIVIAHRVSTIRRAHRVILIDNGHVAATGTHDALIASNERYRSLIAHTTPTDVRPGTPAGSPTHHYLSSAEPGPVL
ncbi:ABC transporter ATP-binding protein [Demequina sediminicola]|uniref:ABC transporter ATP-binding protein n=1 Tax=Demequina sediminicola TaxID=1095026 RepID=UPI000781D1B3|nr:ABC transporter ATP-binding protein [Demequina sediminicola]